MTSRRRFLTGAFLEDLPRRPAPREAPALVPLRAFRPGENEAPRLPVEEGYTEGPPPWAKGDPS